MSHQRKFTLALLAGSIVFVVLACCSCRFFVTIVHSYLQTTKRAPGATILVVEAWLAPHMLKAAKLEFDRGNYALLVATATERGVETTSLAAENSVQTAAAFLRAQGVDSARIVSVPAFSKSRQNTFAEAKAVKNWLLSAGHTGVIVNVFTCNTHGRKSWVAFRRILKGVATVGIVSQPGWQSRGGLGPPSRMGRMRVLLKHGCGYLYALVWPVPR